MGSVTTGATGRMLSHQEVSKTHSQVAAPAPTSSGTTGRLSDPPSESSVEPSRTDPISGTSTAHAISDVRTANEAVWRCLIALEKAKEAAVGFPPLQGALGGIREAIELYQVSIAELLRVC